MARKTSMARRLAAGFVLIAASTVAPAIAAAEDDPTLFTFQGGVYDVIQDDAAAGAFAFEVRGGERFLIFEPFGGMMAPRTAPFTAMAAS